MIPRWAGPIRRFRISNALHLRIDSAVFDRGGQQFRFNFGQFIERAP